MSSGKPSGRPRPWVTSSAYEAAIQLVVAVRRDRKITQRELAERIGKPRSFIAKVESRERRLDFVEFVALARGLGIEPDQLMRDVAAALPERIDF